MSEYGNGFFLTIICFEDTRPLRPWIVCRTLCRRLRHHLKLCHRFCSETYTCTYTVVTGITTTDDQHMFIFCQFIRNFLEIRIQQSLCYLSEEIYGEINSFCFSSRGFNISWIGCSTCKDDTVIFLKKFFCCNVFSYICI